MALEHRKRVRDALRFLLSAEATGFNSMLATVAPVYGVAPFEIDFGSVPSASFFQGFLSLESQSLSMLKPHPVALALYTSDATNDQRIMRSAEPRFLGRVVAHLDFYHHVIDGEETYDTESVADAIEDAVLNVITPGSVEQYGIIYDGGVSCVREAFQQLGDGYQQRIPITFLFEVHV